MMQAKGLRLRPWFDEDAARLHELSKAGSSGFLAQGEVSRSWAHSLGFLQAHLQKEMVWAVEDKMAGVIGSCCLKPRDAEVDFWIADAYLGRDYETPVLQQLMQFAAGEAELSRVWCGFHDGEKSRQHLLEKNGFRLDHWRWSRSRGQELQGKKYLMTRTV